MSLADVEDPPTELSDAKSGHDDAEKSLSELIDERLERCPHCGRPWPPSAMAAHVHSCDARSEAEVSDDE